MKAAKEPEEPRDEAEPAEEQPAAAAGRASEKAEKSAEKAEKSAERAEKSATAEPKAAPSSQIDDLLATVRRLEAFALEEAKRVSDKVLPQAESKARQNIWVSLLFALGLGLILGLWLNGRRRG